ncbi:MAG: hypothetical protein R3B48_18355 [Kofleriaceae bacterium]
MFRRLAWLAFVALASACYEPHAPTGLPCSAAMQCPDDQVCNLELQTCELPPDALWRLDTVDELATGEILHGTLDPDGAISAPRYLTGAVRARGANRLTVPNTRTARWQDVTADPDGEGFVRSVFQPWAAGTPQGVGLTQPDRITVWFEGEIFFDEGDWQVRLLADDEGFAELAPPGGEYARVVEATYEGAITVVFHAPVTGWYAFRGAVKDNSEGMYYLLEAGRDVPRRIPPERLRVAVGSHRGALLEGFASEYLLDPRAVKLSKTIGGSFGITAPLDLGIPTDQEWSVRYASEFYAAKDQTLSLALSSTDGHRLWIDRKLVSDQLTTPGAGVDTAPIALARGWHGVVAELSKRGDDPSTLSMSVVEGDPLLFDPQNLIPAEGAMRLVNAAATGVLTLPAMGTARANLVIGSSSTGTLRAVNTRYKATGALPDVSVQFVTPTSTMTLRATGALQGTEIEDRLTVLPTFSAPLTTWSLLARNTGATAGTFGVVRLSAEYESVNDWVGDLITYVTPLRAVDPSLDVAAIRWTTDPPKAPVKVSARSCKDNTCGDAVWVDVDRSGSKPTLEPGAFLQIRVEAAVSEAAPLRLDAIEVAFLRR